MGTSRFQSSNCIKQHKQNEQVGTRNHLYATAQIQKHPDALCPKFLLANEKASLSDQHHVISKISSMTPN